MHASSAGRFEDGYKAIAEQMRIPGWNNPGTDILSTVCRWLANPQNGTWLVVVDNADDEQLMLESSGSKDSSPGQHALKRYLPTSDTGIIILTSRTKRIATIIAEYDDDVLEVMPMSEPEALLLVQKRMGPKFRMPEAATQMVRHLDLCPLPYLKLLPI